jgi:nucleotide-binding universal stress UspA family protein
VAVREAKVAKKAIPTSTSEPSPEPVTRVPVFPVKCVVVPIDFSESSAAAVVTALELVSKPADVHVLHAVLPSSTFSPTGEWAPLRQGEVVGTVSRNELAAYLEKHNFSGVTQAIEVGDPASIVAAYARKHEADLIVVPSHGYHGVKRMVMGSVAEQIIRHCECAVLVLHRYDSLVRSS